MTETRSARPPVLLSACLYLGLIAGLQVVRVLVVLNDWDSLNGQARLKRYTDPFVDGGMSRGDAETTFRVLLAVLAFVGATAVVLAVYTALGHRASRILLTIIGGALALMCLATGSIFYVIQGAIAMVCIYQLWTPAVRAYFGGASPGTPQARPDPFATPPHADAPVSQQPQLYAPPVAPRPAPRRNTGRTFALITLIGSSFVAFGCAVYLVLYEVSRDELVKDQLDMNLMNRTEAEIRDSLQALAVLSWVVLALCVVAIAVSAVVLLRRGSRR